MQTAAQPPDVVTAAPAGPRATLSPDIALPPFMRLDQIPMDNAPTPIDETMWVGQGEKVRAKLGNRFYGHVVDELIVLAGGALLGMVFVAVAAVRSVRAFLTALIADAGAGFGAWEWTWPDVDLARFLLCVLVWSFVVRGLPLTSKGRTFGRLLNGVRVIRDDAPDPPRMWQALAHWGIARLALVAVLVAFPGLPIAGYSLVWALGRSFVIPFGEDRRSAAERLARLVSVDDRVGTVHARRPSEVAWDLTRTA